MKSKPLIIVAAIVAAILGAWVGMNILKSGSALTIALVGAAGLGYLIYKSLRNNRRVEIVGPSERARLLASTPGAGARTVVYREGFIGKMAGFDIAIDGQYYAQLKSPQSVAIDIAPGNHRLIMKHAGKEQPPFAFSVSSGEIAVLRIGMGIAGAEISRDDGAQTRSKLASIPMVRPDAAMEAASIGTGASV